MPTQRFSNTQTITRENIAKVPADKPGVYRIKSNKGNILYIGLAKGERLGDRIYEHRGRFMRGTQFQYRTTASKDAAEQLERQEINRHILPRSKKK
ncbi:DUF7508 domain-containing protein [Candidatus Spongiihabitans sp.]|uniref:DUF7508 domain-containing protein n=1 Tax=Candidatus Spongiihabitans sp. TaxID=3101308 RepID=UPI003C7C127A